MNYKKSAYLFLLSLLFLFQCCSKSSESLQKDNIVELPKSQQMCCLKFSKTEFSKKWNSGDLEDRKLYWKYLTECGCLLGEPRGEIEQIFGPPDYKNRFYKIENLHAENVYVGCFVQLQFTEDRLSQVLGDCH